MKENQNPAIYLALLHYPVWNKHREIVATAVTNVDIHDIARSARTYGARGVFFVTPIDQQRLLVEEIIGHWVKGGGAERNPLRADAFASARVATTLEDAVAAIAAAEGQMPELIATSARRLPQAVSYRELRQRLKRAEAQRPRLILLGTGWGLGPQVLERADVMLAPVCPAPWAQAGEPYNHLSVRSAAAIILDRLLGDRDDEPNESGEEP